MASRFFKITASLCLLVFAVACSQEEVTLVPSEYSMDAGAKERYLVYFAHDSYALDEVAIRQVEALYQEVTGKTAMLAVNGHTDTTGPDRYNMMLSNQRADAVKDMLISLGMEDKQIQTYGFGETDLAVPTPDETFEPQNRRVEVVVN